MWATYIFFFVSLIQLFLEIILAHLHESNYSVLSKLKGKRNFLHPPFLFVVQLFHFFRLFFSLIIAPINEDLFLANPLINLS